MAERRQQPEARRPGPSAATRVSRGKSAVTPEFSNYQGVILVEFILAELLVAVTPIATGRNRNQPGLSPYAPRDMTKLLAIGLVFFLLQLAAVGGSKWGRFGAWFGALILLTVGLNEAANIANDIGVLAGIKAGAKNATRKAANAVG